MTDDPHCPREGCHRRLHRVRQSSPKMLNDDQFDSIKKGDWFCDQHTDEAPFIYFRDCVREIERTTEKGQDQ